jgi:hypothetical protein
VRKSRKTSDVKPAGQATTAQESPIGGQLSIKGGPDPATGKTGPDFTELEGEGGDYGALSNAGAGYGDEFEHDHIVDQGVANAAARLPLLESPHADRVWAKAEGLRKTPPAASAADRLRELQSSTTLYSPGSGVQTFVEGNGYAVRLYRGIANEVTRKMRSVDTKVSGLRLPPSAEGVASAAEYVRAGKSTDLAAFRKAQQAGLAERIGGISDRHAGFAAEAYAREIRRVANLHADDRQKSMAQLEMTAIATRVRGSLAEARSRTERLFATP